MSESTATADLISMGKCMVELSARELLLQAPSFNRGFGGDALNLAAMAAQLGTRAAYLTAVADDPFGEYLRDAWRGTGVDVSLVRDVDGYNGLYLMAALQTSEREIIYYREGSAAAQMTPEMLPMEALRNVRLFHTSSIAQAISESSRRAVRTAMETVKDAGGAVSFDINYRKQLWEPAAARAAVEEVLPLVDILLPSVPEDTGPLFGLDDPEEAVTYFREEGVPVVIAKAGPLGAWGGWEDQTRHWPPEATEVVDAIGAGDAFCGVLGSVAAGLSVGQTGTAGGLPSQDVVVAALAGRVALP